VADDRVSTSPAVVVTTKRDSGGTADCSTTRSHGVRGIPSPSGWRAVGRLDAATSGLLLLTNDTRLAAWLTDPEHAVTRVYRVTVRGRVTHDEAQRLKEGIVDSRRAAVGLVGDDPQGVRSRDPPDRRIDRRERTARSAGLCAAIGHEVTALAPSRSAG
jgi:23S rRNA-/tRNA-specific pseudouridylate synthase